MQIFLLVVQIIIAICLVGVILIQKNSSDGLSGFGASSGGLGLISSRSQANLLTRITTILAALFVINCLVLANMAGKENKKSSLTDQIIEHSQPVEGQEQPKNQPSNEEPTVPLAK